MSQGRRQRERGRGGWEDGPGVCIHVCWFYTKLATTGVQSKPSVAANQWNVNYPTLLPSTSLQSLLMKVKLTNAFSLAPSLCVFASFVGFHPRLYSFSNLQLLANRVQPFVTYQSAGLILERGRSLSSAGMPRAGPLTAGSRQTAARQDRSLHTDRQGADGRPTAPLMEQCCSCGACDQTNAVTRRLFCLDMNHCWLQLW